jgi:hypothetical protein
LQENKKMANTNLFKSVQETEDLGKAVKRARQGFILPSLFLFIVLLAWGGIKVYSMQETKKVADINNQTIAESQNLQGKNIDRVADFQGRLDKIIQANGSKIDTNNLFTQFQNTIVQGSRATNFEYDSSSNSLKATFLCDDFSVVAREIMSFKESTYFGGAVIDSISRDSQTQKVSLSLVIPVKGD